MFAGVQPGLVEISNGLFSWGGSGKASGNEGGQKSPATDTTSKADVTTTRALGRGEIDGMHDTFEASVEDVEVSVVKEDKPILQACASLLLPCADLLRSSLLPHEAVACDC